jgi:hypothetical protein
LYLVMTINRTLRRVRRSRDRHHSLADVEKLIELTSHHFYHRTASPLATSSFVAESASSALHQDSLLQKPNGKRTSGNVYVFPLWMHRYRGNLQRQNSLSFFFNYDKLPILRCAVEASIPTISEHLQQS